MQIGSLIVPAPPAIVPVRAALPAPLAVRSATSNASDAAIYDVLLRQDPTFDQDGLFRAMMFDGALDFGGSLPGEWRTEYAGGNNRLVPPGGRVEYAGGKYLVTPAQWTVDYAGGNYRLVPPGGRSEYAGGNYVVAPAGWSIDYAGGHHRRVPAGGRSEYAGGFYRVAPSGWSVDYAGGKYLVVPPGGRVDYNGGNYVVVPRQPMSWLDRWFMDQVTRA
jgi:hypothetical protein